MNVERFLILLFLFIVSVFFFPDLQTAISGVSGAEALQPVLNVIPTVFIGVLFFSLVYLGFMGERD